MPYATRAGARLYFEDTGGDGPPVVFSHGILMDHEMFEPQVSALQDSYRCISWDERAHGSTEARGSFSYWDSAEDLFAILDDLSLDSAVLVGMSQGGFLSLRAALLRPERVRGLFLIDTQAGTEDPNVVPLYTGMAESWAAEGPTRQVAETSASIILGEGTDWEPWIAKWFDWPKGRAMDMFQTLVSREDIHDRLGEISCPAQIVHGTADAAIPVEKAEKLCSGLGDCRGVHVIEGGTHAGNLSHPDEVNRVLRDFLESLEL